LQTFINAKSKTYLRKFKPHEKNEGRVKKKRKKDLATVDSIHNYSARPKANLKY
jgi:hypothetical protein